MNSEHVAAEVVMARMTAIICGLLLGLASSCQEYVDSPDAGRKDGDQNCPAACTGGCSAGVCIVVGSDQVAVCPALMPCRISCEDNTCGLGVDCSLATDCHIRCLGDLACEGPIECGTGACHVECGGTGNGNMCLSSIDCRRSSSCEIGCLGNSACLGPITCGSGRCSVQCGGTGAGGMCAGAITCNTSCACDVTCAGGSSCAGTITCPNHCDSWLGCTSAEAGCDSCD